MPLAKEKRLNINYYKILPEGAPYQLIEGELVITPAPNPKHQIILGRIFRHLSDYCDEKEMGIVLVSPIDVYLDSENAFQPDIIYIARDRQHIIKEDGIYGAPDLVIEILSPSTAGYDLKEKFRVYERSGVREYWIVDPEMRSVEIYSNAKGSFSISSKSEVTGEIESLLLDGFRLDIEAIFQTSI